MPLFKLSFETRDAATGQAAAACLTELAEPGALAVTVFEHKLPAFRVEAYYAAEPARDAVACALAPLGAGVGALSVEAVPDQNWVALSQAALPPVVAGRFVVHGSHDRARIGFRRHAIEIEAGEAFGTGHNATTALCLEALDTLARRQRFARVLDLGCGSGVLAIAAARTFARARVIASDNDPVATAIARANVRLNRVAASVRVVTAADLNHAALRAARPFDLVLANILPRPLIRLAPALHRALRPGGVAVLSGLLDHQACEVRATYLAVGFRFVRAASRDGWTALVLQRV